MDINQLTKNLEQLPTEIRKAELEVITAKAELKDKELEYDVAFANETIKAQAPNAAEKKAHAVINTKEYKKEVLNKNVEYERKNSEFNFLTNQYISARKLASLLEKTHSPESSGF